MYMFYLFDYARVNPVNGLSGGMKERPPMITQSARRNLGGRSETNLPARIFSSLGSKGSSLDMNLESGQVTRF